MCENQTCNLESCDIPYGYCHCGCGRKTTISKWSDKCHNYIKNQPRMFIKTHQNRLGPIDYIINEETGCWEWQRATDKDGYGLKCVNYKLLRAHRYYYEQKYGPIVENLQLDHICRNTRCVNPEHLEPVTTAENTRRGKVSKLSKEKAKNIRNLKNMLTNQQIATIFGVTQPTISRIMTNKYWRET